ncbi:MAG: ATP-grasp domain-containing protein [Kiritimatiellaeota bacterium]|nr:ATP-grasp domain-containing protein [Kiritimatiellota bacterium]
MTVLLSAVGRRAYLVGYFQEALKPYGGKVVTANTTMDATGMLMADAAEVVPPAKSPDYVDAMLAVCRRHGIQLLFSLHDWEAPYLARARDRFLAIGTTPVMPSPDVMDVCLDKFKTFVQMKALGIPTPRVCLDRDEALRELAFPMMVKPRLGQGSLGVFKVNTPDELAWAYQLSLSAVESFGLASSIADCDTPAVLVQACVSGDEYGCDIVNDLQGNFVTAFVKRKLAMRAGETDVAVTVEDSRIAECAKQISAWSRHPGIMDADFFLDRSGEVWLLELNPRFGGGYPFSHAAGANLPAAFVAWASGQTPASSWIQVRPNVKAYKDIQVLVSAAHVSSG